MMLRLWWISGSLLVAVGWTLTVFYSPGSFQASAPGRRLQELRAEGMAPAYVVSAPGMHDIFETPDTDAEHLARAMTSMGGMAGMDHTQMQHGTQQPESGMAGMDHTQMQHGMQQPESGMAGMDHSQMAGMEHSAGGMAEADGDDEHGPHGGGSVKAGLTIVAQGASGQLGARLPSLGVSKTIQIDMHEWGYTPNGFEAKPGDTVHMVVRNAGSLPHEFMIMSGPAMNAVDYRLRRADWNLLEHEALYERPVVLPGETFELVAQIHKPGMWMYMCMFPFHMQFGMMGMMMTPGMSMDMPGHSM